MLSTIFSLNAYSTTTVELYRPLFDNGDVIVQNEITKIKVYSEHSLKKASDGNTTYVRYPKTVRKVVDEGRGGKLQTRIEFHGVDITTDPSTGSVTIKEWVEEKNHLGQKVAVYKNTLKFSKNGALVSKMDLSTEDVKVYSQKFCEEISAVNNDEDTCADRENKYKEILAKKSSDPAYTQMQVMALGLNTPVNRPSLSYVLGNLCSEYERVSTSKSLMGGIQNLQRGLGGDNKENSSSSGAAK